MKTLPPTDQELFARIAHDDAHAFRQLYDKYFHVLHTNAGKLLKSDLWSEEVTQEAMLYIWEHRSILTTIEHPGAWLYRIVSNKCLDRIRRQGVEIRAQYSLQTMTEAPMPHSRLDYQRLKQLIAEAIERLPDQQRMIYQLQQEELSYKEIAVKLNISPNTVRNHLVRANSSVREYLVSHGEYLPLFIILLLF